MEPRIPRGVGFDKRSVLCHLRQIDATSVTVDRYARRNGLAIESFCLAIERSFPDWWARYAATHEVPTNKCEYCGRTFVRSRADQRYCSPRCGRHARVDEAYFGGRRRETAGLNDGICQLCVRPGKTLAAHHIWGKGNDPGNAALTALCPGCHEAVTALALRPFLDQPGGWERLIDLVHRRRHGRRRLAGTEVTVRITERSTS